MNRRVSQPSPRKKRLATRLFELYQGRSDVYWVHVPGEGVPSPRHGRMTAEAIERQHLSGEACLGSYVVFDSNKCRLGTIDLDSKEHKPDPAIQTKLRAVTARLASLSLHYLVARSQSGKGFHVTVFFAEPVFAKDVRRLLRSVCAAAGCKEAEVFPKQDLVEPSKFGNAIRLPLFNKSHFVDVSTLAPINPLVALDNVRCHTNADADLQQALKSAGCYPLPAVKRKLFPNAKGDFEHRLSEYVNSLLQEDHKLSRRWNGKTAGLHDTSRSALLMSITVMLLQRYATPEEVREALLAWSTAHRYDQGQRSDWIDRTITKAYEFLQENRAPANLFEPCSPLIQAEFVRRRRRK